MSYKKYLKIPNGKMAQASLEYFVLLAAIGAITMIVGSSFLSRTKTASAGLFSTAVERILDP